MALEPSKHVNGRMWPPGVSGNPNGRPVGSRTVFSQGLLKEPSLCLGRAWSRRHGKDGNRVPEVVPMARRSSSIGRGLRQDARSPWHLTSAFRRISQMCYKSVSGCAMMCART
jgi:hypothetical protein